MALLELEIDRGAVLLQAEYCGSKKFVNTIGLKIKELFGIDEADITKASIEK